MNTYGERLSEALADTGKDRKWLAESIGITVQALSPLMAGKTVALTASNHEKAVRALNVNGMWLATGSGEKSPTDPLANPPPPLSNIHQIRETGRYYGKQRIIESIAILESLTDEQLIEAAGLLRGFALGVAREKNGEASLPNHLVPAAQGAAG